MGTPTKEETVVHILNHIRNAVLIFALTANFAHAEFRNHFSRSPVETNNFVQVGKSVRPNSTLGLHFRTVFKYGEMKIPFMRPPVDFKRELTIDIAAGIFLCPSRDLALLQFQIRQLLSACMRTSKPLKVVASPVERDRSLLGIQPISIKFNISDRYGKETGVIMFTAR